MTGLGVGMERNWLPFNGMLLEASNRPLRYRKLHSLAPGPTAEPGICSRPKCATAVNEMLMCLTVPACRICSPSPLLQCRAGRNAVGRHVPVCGVKFQVIKVFIPLTSKVEPHVISA